MAKRVAILLAVVFSAAAQPPAAPARRLAIVIANFDYQKLPRLTSPSNEAQAIVETLAAAGFLVRRAANIGRLEFLTTESSFLKDVQPGDSVLFYYSGYAVQGDDDNYLLPVDFEPQDTNDLDRRSYHLSRMQQKLDERGAALKIFILEGSRAIDVPIAGAGPPGLMAQPDVSPDSLFAFAAAPGQTVPTSAATIGRLTDAVVRNIALPGLRVVDVFGNAKREVATSTNTAQNPFVQENILHPDFFFHAPKAAESPKPQTGPQKGVPYSNRKDREEYLFIPSGAFKMGCVPSDKGCKDDEKPQHRVEITKSFWMGRNEVQVDSYRRFVGKKMPSAPLWDHHWERGNLPIVNVSWENARDYCGWAGGRLPTEAEWEYAARAGEEDEIYPLNNENSRDKANFAGKKGNDIYDQEPAPVRKFDASSVGLYDMAGNVWEWVSDYYFPDYYSRSPKADPTGPPEGKQHPIRGGSFDSDPKKHLRISIREAFGKSGNTVGFRCVLEDNPESRKNLSAP
jgi:formylglycine-generating enzyme